MIDAESAIFDKVASRFSQSYPGGSCYSELVDTLKQISVPGAY